MVIFLDLGFRSSLKDYGYGDDGSGVLSGRVFSLLFCFYIRIVFVEKDFK